MAAIIMNLNTSQIATVSTNPDTFHTAAEWETWRSLITQLYFTEDKTLKMVRQILATEHDFHAT